MKTIFTAIVRTRAGGALVLATALALPAQAQPDTGGPMPGPTGGPTGVPLDGGASLLLASGVAYGLKQLRNRRRTAAQRSAK